jgi:rare lipoprotein A (peptidoglycan hydrolase)
MMVLSKSCRAERVRLACIGLSASALAAMALPVKFATPAEAKTPGSTYCYHKVCHRVKTIEETQALIGIEEQIVASHYDDCSRDRYNPCGLTSSGEQFHPDRPDNTASPIYPDGTTLLVWSPENERALVVRVNNAGPYWGDRKLDLSRAAAEKLGFEGKGVASVRVRVIKAPEPEETKYVANRNYPPVPGDIGQYASLEQAQTGMVVALALQASAASPLAPVTTANVFATPGAEPLVAEAPQALGRTPASVAAADLTSRVASLNLGGFTTRSLKPLHPWSQSRGQVAALGLDRELNQSMWGEDLIETGALPAPDDGAEDAAEKAASERPQAAPVAEEEAKPEKKSEKKRIARREKQEKVASASSRSRKTAARNERRSRATRSAASGRSSQRVRVAYSAQRYVRTGAPERSAGQIMSLGIRAQASSTM